ncbi:MAG: MFS transporter [Coriobacteriia bacterium]|nr:MFS transporter [Coriobacteriia bacterium]
MNDSCGPKVGAVEEVVANKGAYRRLLKNRQFRRMWYAQFVSGIGDWLVLGFLMPLVTTLSGGSSFAVAGILIAKIIPALVLSSLTGVLVDRFDRRKVMITADIVRAALTIVLVFTNSVWLIYLVVLLMETASLFFWPARNSLIPYLVEEDDIVSANGLAYTTQQASMLIGLTAAAGILAGLEALVRAAMASNLPIVSQIFSGLAPALLGPRAGVILDIFTFLFSAAMITSIHVVARASQTARMDAVASTGPGHALRLLGKDVIDSFKFLGSHKELRGLLITIFLAILGGGAIVPVGSTYVTKNLVGGLPFADKIQVLQQLTASPQTFMLVFMALGMVAGALVVPRLEHRIRLQPLFAGSVAAFGLSLMGFASVNQYWLAGVFAALAGACIAIVTVAGNSYIVRTTADELRGRVFTAMESVIRVALLLSMVVMAPLADLIGASAHDLLLQIGLVSQSTTMTGSRITLQFASIIVLAAAVYAFVSLQWRHAEKVDPHV